MLATLTCLLLLASPAADAARPPEPPARASPYKLKLRPAADLSAIGVLAAGWFASEVLLKHQLAPASCRWCQVDPTDAWLSGVRAPLEQQRGVDLASSAVGFALVPIVALGINSLLGWKGGASLADGFWDAVLVLESMLCALAVTQTVKFLVGRERPFASRLSAEDKAAVKDSADSNLSFFSGHTSFAFAVATAAGTIARLRGYKHGWLAWAVGLPLAALTGLLRMVADKHWASDVFVGAAVGAVSGYFVPTLFHGREGDEAPRVSIAPMPLGLAVSMRL